MRMQPEQKNNFDAPRSSHRQRPYRLYNRRSSFVVNGNAFFLTASRGRLHWSEKAVAEKKKKQSLNSLLPRLKSAYSFDPLLRHQKPLNLTPKRTINETRHHVLSFLKHSRFLKPKLNHLPFHSQPHQFSLSLTKQFKLLPLSRTPCYLNEILNNLLIIKLQICSSINSNLGIIIFSLYIIYNI